MKYLIVLLLAGCATSSPTFLPSGDKGFSLDCSGSARTWNMCYEKAGELCGSKGYKVITGGSEQGVVVAGNANGVFGGSTMNRSMLIQCQ